MQHALDAPRSQLAGIDDARPTRRAALTRLDSQAAELRDQLRAVDAALRSLSEGDSDTDTLSGQERKAFTRGRISATLSTLTRTDDQALRRLRLEYEAAARAVTALEAELDDNEERMQLDSRLAVLSGDMTRWSQDLNLEHANGVRLDINRLT
jgi:chromosome segregation ATPase